SSAGTSSRKRRVAVSMRVFASSAIARVIRGGRARRLDLVALQELSPDDHALDLGGALADEQQRRVAVETLDLVLLGVAVAAVDAKALLDAEAAGLGGEQLRHPGLEIRALAGVLQARGAPREQARGVDLRGHV